MPVSVISRKTPVRLVCHVEMGTESGPPALQRNHILNALAPAARAPLLAQMTLVVHELKDVLFEAQEPIDAVHFPLDCVISLVTPFESGAIVEVATVGNEGVVGVPLVHGGSLAVRGIALVPGRSLRMEARAFLTAFEQAGPFNALVCDYTQALFSQISQAVACNRLHSDEERLSRWLVMIQDRVGADQFIVADEFLGRMMGSRPAAITLFAGVLQEAGLIRYAGGRVTILDRERLEEVSCECYGAIEGKLGGALTGAEGHSQRGR